MRKILSTLFFLLAASISISIFISISIPLLAQPSRPTIVLVTADPSGPTSCSLPWQWNINDGVVWYPGQPSGGSCTWTNLAGGSGPGGPYVPVQGGVNMTGATGGPPIAGGLNATQYLLNGSSIAPVASPQYQFPFYSAAGTASTLSGSPKITTDPNGNLNAAVIVNNVIPLNPGNTAYGTLDCTGTSDSTAAVQAALNAAGAVGAAACGANAPASASPTSFNAVAVQIPHACMVKVSQISIPSCVSLQGENKHDSGLIQTAGANESMIVLASNTTIRTRLKSLTVNGNAANETGTNPTIFYNQSGLVSSGVGSPRHILDDLYVTNTVGDCIYILGDAGGDWIQNGVHAEYCGGDALYFHAPDSHILNCELDRSQGYGLEGWVGTDEAGNCKIWGNGLGNTTTTGAWFSGNNWYVHDMNLQSNVGHGGYFDSCISCSAVNITATLNGVNGGTFGGWAMYNSQNSYVQMDTNGGNGGTAVQPYGLVLFNSSGNANNTYVIDSAFMVSGNVYGSCETTDMLILNGASGCDFLLDNQVLSTSGTNPVSAGLRTNFHYQAAGVDTVDEFKQYAQALPGSGNASAVEEIFKYYGSEPFSWIWTNGTASVSLSPATGIFQGPTTTPLLVQAGAGQNATYSGNSGDNTYLGFTAGKQWAVNDSTGYFGPTSSNTTAQLASSTTPISTAYINSIVSPPLVQVQGVYDSASPLTANLGSTPLYTAPATTNEKVEVECYVVLTTAATTSTLPTCNVAWTDADTGDTFSAAALTSTSAGNTVGATYSSSARSFFYIKANTSLTLTTAGYVSAPAATMAYTVHAEAWVAGK